MLGRWLNRFRSRRKMGGNVAPLSYQWGHDRGLALHRHYVNEFLARYAADVRGRCLEFEQDVYTTKTGGTQVTRCDVLDLNSTNPHATIIADQTRPNTIPSDSFDCIICTHVLHIIWDVRPAMQDLHRILKPGGTLLVAVPLVSMCDPAWGELWRFTPHGLRRLCEEWFPADRVTTHAYGNSLTAAGELRGLVTHEFTPAELTTHDERFALEVCARAVK